MNVQSILSVKGTDVATITHHATLADAAAKLHEYGIGALVVSDDGATIAGIVSERDLVRSFDSHGVSTFGRKVSTCMSEDVVTCRAGDSLDALMGLMTERRVRHLPVVDDAGRLAGIISIGDVVKARLGELERENSQLHDYIQGNVS